MHRSRTRLVRIGNSQGFRVPKAAMANLPQDVEFEMTVTGDQITLRPVDAIAPRDSWGALIDAADLEADAADFADWDAALSDGLDDEPPPVPTGRMR